ncbi:hypothetical protein FOA52_009180 [Chlamydomonas sp. UWO 241]|nr:hypothetical protein FOA52_009180 [Chlamydomonas sp. UWO 241]
MSEWLMAIAIRPSDPSAAPTHFETFCRVGTGLNESESEQLRSLLHGNIVSARPEGLNAPSTRPEGFRAKDLAQAKKRVPSWLTVTPGLKELPDVWVRDPAKSVVFEIKADARCIRSSQFASSYSLRFPRVMRIRDDLGLHDVKTAADLLENILRLKGRFDGNKAEDDDNGDGGGDGGGGRGKRRGRWDKKLGGADARAPKRVKAGVSVPEHLRPVDVSGVETQANLLGGAFVTLLGRYPSNLPREQLQTIVKELGGRWSENVVESGASATKYVLAAGRKEVEAYCTGRYDILHVNWLLHARDERRLALPPPPRQVLCYGVHSKGGAAGGRSDKHGDPWFVDLDAGGADLRAILGVHMDKEDVLCARDQLTVTEAAAEKVLARHGHTQPHDAPYAPGRLVARPLLTLQESLLAEMEAAGLDPPRLGPLRRCVVFVLQLPPAPSAAAAAAAAGAAGAVGGGFAAAAAGVPAFAPSAVNAAGAAAAAASAATTSVAGAPYGPLAGCAEAAAAAADAADALSSSRVAALQLGVRIAGGRVAGALGRGVTHVAVAAPPNDGGDCSGNSGGGGISCGVVTPERVLAALGAAARASAAQPSRMTRGRDGDRGGGDAAVERRARRLMRFLRERLRVGGSGGGKAGGAGGAGRAAGAGAGGGGATAVHLVTAQWVVDSARAPGPLHEADYAPRGEAGAAITVAVADAMDVDMDVAGWNSGAGRVGSAGSSGGSGGMLRSPNGGQSQQQQSQQQQQHVSMAQLLLRPQQSQRQQSQQQQALWADGNGGGGAGNAWDVLTQMGTQLPLQQQQHMSQAQAQAQRQQQLPALRPPSEWDWRPFVARARGSSGSNGDEQASNGELDSSSDDGGGGGGSGGEVQEVAPPRRAAKVKPAAKGDKARAKRPPKAPAHPGSARAPPGGAGGARKRGPRGAASSTDEDKDGCVEVETEAGGAATTPASKAQRPRGRTAAAVAAPANEDEEGWGEGGDSGGEAEPASGPAAAQGEGAIGKQRTQQHALPSVAVHSASGGGMSIGALASALLAGCGTVPPQPSIRNSSGDAAAAPAATHRTAAPMSSATRAVMEILGGGGSNSGGAPPAAAPPAAAATAAAATAPRPPPAAGATRALMEMLGGGGGSNDGSAPPAAAATAPRPPPAAGATRALMEMLGGGGSSNSRSAAPAVAPAALPPAPLAPPLQQQQHTHTHRPPPCSAVQALAALLGGAPISASFGPPAGASSSGLHQILHAVPAAAGVPAAQLAAPATAAPASSANNVLEAARALDARPKRSLKDMLRSQGQADGE